MASTVIGKAVIHYVESDGSSWGAFLQKKLSEAQYDIPTELHEMRAPWLETSKYDVNVVLVSPDFLVLDSFEKLERCRTAHSLAILLGTGEAEFQECVMRQNLKSRLLQWVCYSPKQTRDSVKGLLLTIINLYENLHGGDEVDEEESCPEDPLFELVPETNSDRGSSIEGDNTVDYDTLPPVRQINALHDVLRLPSSEDADHQEILILLDRKADSDLMLTLDSGETIQTEEIDKAVYKAKIHKNLIQENGIEFVAVCKNQSFGSMKCEFGNKSQTCESLNQSNNKESSNPELSSGLDIINEILEKETDPVYLLCKALRIPYADHEQLDQHLAGRCRRLRITEHFSELIMRENTEIDNDTEWPTLLHFCADTNLLQSTNELLQIPCLVAACLKCNRNHETPKDIAKRNGFTDMVKLLEKQHLPGQTKVARLRSSDSGILDSNEDYCFHVDPIGASMREKTGVNGGRNVDSGVSGLQRSYASTESYHMDMSTSRIGSVKSAPSLSLSSSISDLRPSGNYDTIERGTLSRSYREPLSSNPFLEGQKEGESTWFVEPPPQYRFPQRRSSESDKDSIRASLTSQGGRKGSGSFGQKKQSFSKTISSVFKKRKNSMVSAPEKTIPEEAQSSQCPTEDRSRGFPCSPITSFEDFQKEEVLLSADPPMKGSLPHRDSKSLKQREEGKEVPKRSHKKIKNPFKKKVDRRKSLRMSRVLKDNNVAVLALPTKNDMHV